MHEAKKLVFVKLKHITFEKHILVLLNVSIFLYCILM